ncbi:hypothetical protein B296_00017942 [Ensete ventricosum]|uniref:Uncharacterized protein n=1 Tax=Ensete ventricosum TaxID=4639 RepID=A0A427B4C3_ENSVE|nr:hypothetical protein B296_00017942 [Ensete ventricosum]
MASVKIAGILSVVFSLLFLLSHATRVPLLPDATTAVAFPELPEDFDPTTAEQVPAEDADPTALTASIEKVTSEHPLPALVEGFDHVDLSLRRPMHRHHRCRHHHHHDHHDHHGHRFHGIRVVPYGNDMIQLPKGGEVDAGSEAEGREGRMEWPLVSEWEGERRRTRKNKEHKKKRAEEEDSDSDSDDEEEMEMRKKELKFGRRRMERTEQRGWLNWFRAMWD